MSAHDMNYDQRLAQLLASCDPETFDRLRALARQAQTDLHTVLCDAVRFAADAGARRTVACWACEQDRPDNILPCPTCHRPWSPG
jgi:hypothetical protein